MTPTSGKTELAVVFPFEWNVRFRHLHTLQGGFPSGINEYWSLLLIQCIYWIQVVSYSSTLIAELRSVIVKHCDINIWAVPKSDLSSVLESANRLLFQNVNLLKDAINYNRDENVVDYDFHKYFHENKRNEIDLNYDSDGTSVNQRRHIISPIAVFIYSIVQQKHVVNVLIILTTYAKPKI